MQTPIAPVPSSQTVFISGASRGIGAAIAERLAEGGFDIWLNYHSAHDQARAVQKKIEVLGRKCLLLPFDITKIEEVSRVLAPLLEREIPFGMVHNAGITRDTLLPMMRREEWDQVIDVHLNGFFNLARMFSKVMLGKRKGRIIAISSVSGQTGQAGQVN